MSNDAGSKTDEGNSVRYTVFTCLTYIFAINIDLVKEVLAHPRLTRVPNVKSYINGVFNLRGKIYTIIDIQRLFKVGTGEDRENSMVILIGRPSETLGIAVDQVNEMITIADREIEKPGQEIPPAFSAYVSGYCDKNDARIYIINVASLIRHDLGLN